MDFTTGESHDPRARSSSHNMVAPTPVGTPLDMHQAPTVNAESPAFAPPDGANMQSDTARSNLRTKFHERFRQITSLHDKYERNKYGGGRAFRAAAEVYFYSSAGRTLWRFFDDHMRNSLQRNWEAEIRDESNHRDGLLALKSMQNRLYFIHGPDNHFSENPEVADYSSSDFSEAKRIRNFLFDTLLEQSRANSGQERVELSFDLQTAINAIFLDIETPAAYVAEIV